MGCAPRRNALGGASVRRRSLQRPPGWAPSRYNSESLKFLPGFKSRFEKLLDRPGLPPRVVFRLKGGGRASLPLRPSRPFAPREGEGGREGGGKTSIFKPAPFGWPQGPAVTCRRDVRAAGFGFCAAPKESRACAVEALGWGSPSG